jgi:Domain of unknown function (DUF4395)
MKPTIKCPVDHIPVNENQIRFTALFVLLLTCSYLFTGHWAIPLFLVIDFFLRGFGYGAYSPLNLLSAWLVKKLSIPNKPIDRAPKLFAAQIGFFLSDILLIAVVVELKGAAYAIAGLLILFSFLESAFSFCAGCHMYHFLKKFFPGMIMTP